MDTNPFLPMFHVAILSASVRTGRQSHKVALYFQRYLTENQLATTEMLDLKEFNFPLSVERLSYLPDPPENMKVFSEKIKNADAVIVVSPEYNQSMPASLKNAVDLLFNEWLHKPIGLATASSGAFGGVNALAQMQNLFLRVKAVPSSTTFPTPRVQDAFDDAGQPADRETTDKRAAAFVKELLWLAAAFQKMKA